MQWGAVFFWPDGLVPPRDLYKTPVFRMDDLTQGL